ncbi:MAG: septum site-determining protein MinC, partial [Clostridiales bacterium]
GLVFYFNTNEMNFKDLCQSLEEKLLSSQGFLKGADYFLQSDRPFSEQEKEIIEGIMSRNGLNHGDEALSMAQGSSAKDIDHEEIYDFSPQEDDLPVFKPEKGDTVLLSRSIRSGQQIAVIGNAVIMGDINIGGEVIASGNIIIMGNCRGIVHAGAEGDKKAFIIATDLNSPQLRIADIAAINNQAEKGDTGLFLKKNRHQGFIPQIAFLKEDTLLIDNYQGNFLKCLDNAIKQEV